MSEQRFVLDKLYYTIMTPLEKIKISGGRGYMTYMEVVDTLNEQQATISRLEEENDNMNLFIKQTIEPLLFDCVSEMITIESMSQIELADKIEKEIIPFIQDFKYLKYESLEEEKQDKSE